MNFVIEGLETVDDLANQAEGKVREFVVWLGLLEPLTEFQIQQLAIAGMYEDAQLVEIGQPRDMRVNQDGERPGEVGDIQQPIKLAIALPTGAQIRSGAVALEYYAAAIGRWALNLGKIGVAYVVGDVALNLTDDETGTGAFARLSIPIVLLIIALYLLNKG